MKAINKKGMTNLELMTLLALIIVLGAILLSAFAKNGSKQKYDVLIKNTNNLASTLIKFNNQYPEYSNDVYLAYAIKENASQEFLNPFGGDKYCDKYESKLETLNGKKYVTLKCGEYIVYKHQIGTSSYKIYKVGSWELTALDGENETLRLYNYYKNGKLALSDYKPISEFLIEYNKNEGKKIYRIDMLTDVELITKVVYRNRKLVKEIS